MIWNKKYVENKINAFSDLEQILFKEKMITEEINFLKRIAGMLSSNKFGDAISGIKMSKSYMSKVYRYCLKKSKDNKEKILEIKRNFHELEGSLERAKDHAKEGEKSRNPEDIHSSREGAIVACREAIAILVELERIVGKS